MQGPIRMGTKVASAGHVGAVGLRASEAAVTQTRFAKAHALRVRIRRSDTAWQGCGIKGALGVPFWGGGGGQIDCRYIHGGNQVETWRKRAPLGSARAIIAGLEAARVAP